MKLSITIFSLVFVVIAAIYIWNKQEKEEYISDYLNCIGEKDRSQYKGLSLKEAKNLADTCKRNSGDIFGNLS